MKLLPTMTFELPENMTPETKKAIAELQLLVVEKLMGLGMERVRIINRFERLED